MATLKSQHTLADLQQFIASFVHEKGWENRTAVELMLMLTEEVGEVAKAVRKEAELGYEKPTTTDHLAEELVDVLNLTVDIANRFDIDLEKAFHAKWQKNFTRKWTY
jgi:NTP pyrophosphatase (non-canonical NTP hydrolase)